MTPLEIGLLVGMRSRMYSPTETGAMASSRTCRMRLGTGARGRSARLSAQKVASAKVRAATGSVEQKLSCSSPASSGRSGCAMTTGAR